MFKSIRFSVLVKPYVNAKNTFIAADILNMIGLKCKRLVISINSSTIYYTFTCLSQINHIASTETWQTQRHGAVAIKKTQQVLHAQLTPQIIPRICQENNLSSHSRHDILIRTKYYHFAIKYREQFMLLAQAMANKWFNSSRTTVVYMVLHKERSVVIKFSHEL